MKLLIRKLIGFFVKLYPGSWGYSDCERCGRTWNIAREHSTDLGDGGGMFALCEYCWNELTPQERLPYYLRVYNSWARWGGGRHSWSTIENAVIKGG